MQAGPAAPAPRNEFAAALPACIAGSAAGRHPAPPSAAKAEAGVLRGVRDQKRCCIATIGGGGASADAGVYDHLYGTIIIWLGERRHRLRDRADAMPADCLLGFAQLTCVGVLQALH